MTVPVVWLCRDCQRPVSFTADITRLDAGRYIVHADPHITAHQAQHRG